VSKDRNVREEIKDLFSIVIDALKRITDHFGIDTFQLTRWSVVKKFWPGCARSILVISFIAVA